MLNDSCGCSLSRSSGSFRRLWLLVPCPAYLAALQLTTLGVPITKIIDSKVLDMMSNDKDAENKADEGEVEEADPADVEE